MSNVTQSQALQTWYQQYISQQQNAQQAAQAQLNAQNAYGLGSSILGQPLWPQWTPPTTRDILNSIEQQLTSLQAYAANRAHVESMLRDVMSRTEIGDAVKAHVTPEWYARYEAARRDVTGDGG